jgi:hypothetical protein
MGTLIRVALVVLLPLAGAACALTTPSSSDDARVAAVGRVVDIDPNHGYAIVKFPTHTMFVTLDKRDLGKFIVGDEMRVDSFGRALPPRAGAGRPAAAGG